MPVSISLAENSRLDTGRAGTVLEVRPRSLGTKGEGIPLIRLTGCAPLHRVAPEMQQKVRPAYAPQSPPQHGSFG